jgi:periplasmic protein TonB
MRTNPTTVRLWTSACVVLLLHAGFFWWLDWGLSQSVVKPSEAPEAQPLQLISVISDVSTSEPPALAQPPAQPRAAISPAPPQKTTPSPPAVPVQQTPTPDEADAASSEGSTAANSTVSPQPSGATGSAQITKPSSREFAQYNPKPPYPAVAKRLRIQGTVVVRVWVEPDGLVGHGRVAVSSGEPLLDESALTTVLTWRFKPGTVNGVAQGMWVTQPVRFVFR